MVSYTGPDDRLFQGVLLDATKRSGTIDKCLFVFFILSHLTEAILSIQLWIAIVLFVLSFHRIAFQLFSQLFLFISAKSSLFPFLYFCNFKNPGTCHTESHHEEVL